MPILDHFDCSKRKKPKGSCMPKLKTAFRPMVVAKSPFWWSWLGRPSLKPKKKYPGDIKNKLFNYEETKLPFIKFWKFELSSCDQRRVLIGNRVWCRYILDMVDNLNRRWSGCKPVGKVQTSCCKAEYRPQLQNSKLESLLIKGKAERLLKNQLIISNRFYPYQLSSF